MSAPSSAALHRFLVPEALRDAAPQLLGLQIEGEELPGGLRVTVYSVRRDGGRRRQLSRVVPWQDVLADEHAAAASTTP